MSRRAKLEEKRKKEEEKRLREEEKVACSRTLSRGGLCRVACGKPASPTGTGTCADPVPELMVMLACHSPQAGKSSSGTLRLPGTQLRVDRV